MPPAFAETDGWNTEYNKYHSPGWWREYFESSEAFEVRLSEEVLDGDIFWEDEVLYRGDRDGWERALS